MINYTIIQMDKESKIYESFDDLFDDPDFHFPFSVMSKPMLTFNYEEHNNSSANSILMKNKHAKQRKKKINRKKLMVNRRVIKISKLLKK
jgi:hypothetical protein